LKQNDSVFSSLFAYYPTGRRTLIVRGHAENTRGEYVSGEYFRGLEVTPAAGRIIVADDDRIGGPLVTVLSMGLSQRIFGNAANAVGQTILIDNLPVTVIGVAPPEFFGVDPEANPDFYVALHMNVVLDGTESWAKTPQSYHDRNYYWIGIMG